MNLQLKRNLRTRSLFATLLLLLGFTNTMVVTAADAWPQFFGPSGDGIVAHSNAPTTWNQDTNIAFRTELPGQGWSSPVVGDGIIYVSAAIAAKDAENEFDLSLLLINADTGKVIKNVPLLRQKSKGARIHKKNTHASPTPILDGDRIYVHFGYQGTVCVDYQGNILWKNQELFFKPVHGNGGTPALVGDRLIFTCDGAKDPKVVALDTSNGKIAWEVERPVDAKKKFSFCTPTAIQVDGKTQVIAPGSDCVLAINPSNGKTIWHLRYTGYSVVPKPVFHQGRLFLSTGFDSAVMLSIDPTGTGDVTDSHLVWSMKKNVPLTPSILAHDGLIYTISDNGIAMCVESESGKVVYQKRIGGNFSSSPLLINGNLYFTDEGGKTTVAKAGREFTELAENDLGERTLATMAVDSDALIMRTEKAIYRIAK